MLTVRLTDNVTDVLIQTQNFPMLEACNVKNI